jgi:hypothetical protein
MGVKVFGALAIAGAFGLLVTGEAFAQDNGRSSGKERGGWVAPCSLDGVNPVQHPDIFGNPAIARSYGFVRTRDGGWQVVPNCHR